MCGVRGTELDVVFHCVLPRYANKRSLPKLCSMFLSIKLHCFKTKENVLMLGYLRRKIWIKCITSYQEQKMCFLMQCFPDLSKGNSSWLHQARGLHDSPQNLSNVWIQIHWKYPLFRWKLQSWRLKAHPRVTSGCTVSMTRPGALLSNRKQPAVFKLHTWQFVLLTSTPSLSRGVLWCGRVKRKDSPRCFSSSEGPAAFNSVPTLIPPQPPVQGTAVAATHSWQGSRPWKAQQHLQDNFQHRMSAKYRQDANCLHDLGSAPSYPPWGVPSFFSTPTNNDPFSPCYSQQPPKTSIPWP